MVTTWLPHGYHSYHGNYMVTTWLPLGYHGYYVWLLHAYHGYYMVTTWLLHGNHVVHGNHMVITWLLSYMVTMVTRHGGCCSDYYCCSAGFYCQCGLVLLAERRGGLTQLIRDCSPVSCAQTTTWTINVLQTNITATHTSWICPRELNRLPW